ncbi:OmpA family protein [Nitriliruptoraceae bacterium ZYF776]|nr:OmpA family protein [Profundirhabdus halotolerans]
MRTAHRRLAVPTALALAVTVAGPAAAEPEEFDPSVPEGVEVPLGSLEIFDERPASYPRSLLSIYTTDPGDSTREELLDTFEAEEGPDGTVLTVPDQVLFDFGSADLRDSATDRLARLLRLLEGVSGTITVLGHTDDIGTDAANQTLSEQRAEAVASYLADNGVERDRIVTEGRGSSEPVADNQTPDGSDDPEGRQANRRVEVVVELD